LTVINKERNTYTCTADTLNNYFKEGGRDVEQKWEELKALEEQDEKNLTPEGKEALEQLKKELNS
jgi:GTPase SAR1 family protein